MPEHLDIAGRPPPRYLANRRIEKNILLLVLFLAWQLYGFVRDYEELRRGGTLKPREANSGVAAHPLTPQTVVCATAIEPHMAWPGFQIKCSASGLNISSV